MKKYRKIARFLLLALFVAVMLYITMKDDAADIVTILKNLNLRHTIFLIFASLLTYVIAGITLTKLTKRVNPSYPMHSGISNALVSLFLMNVTASAVAKAGQMLMFKMKKVDLDQSCSILVVDQIMYQISYIALCLTVFFLNITFFQTSLPNEVPFAIFGLLISFVPIIAIAMIFLWPSLQRRFTHWITNLAHKIKPSFDVDGFEQKVDAFINSLHEANTLYAGDWKLLFGIHLWNTLRLVLRHSLPLFVAIALHIEVSVYEIPLFFGASIFVDLVLSALPVYGKHGVAESTFVLVFTVLTGKASAASIMLIWRAITFYTNTIIGGLVMMISPDISMENLRKVKEEQRTT